MIFPVLIVVCLSAVANANPYLVATFELRKAFHDCKNELNITVSIEKETSLTPPLNYTIFDKSYACLTKCTLEKAGLLSATGEFKFREFPGEFAAIGEECSRLRTGATHTERSHSLAVCLLNGFSEKLNQLVIQCAKETGTDVDVHKAYNLKEFLGKESYYCMNRCTLIALKKVNNDNSLNLDLVAYYSPPKTNIADIVEKCEKKTQSSNVCKHVVDRDWCLNEIIDALGLELLKP